MDYLLYLWDESSELEMSPVIMLLMAPFGFGILLGFCAYMITSLPLAVLILPGLVLIVINAVIWNLIVSPCTITLVLIFVSSTFFQILFPSLDLDQDLQTLKDLLNQTMNMKDLMIQNKTIFL